MQKTTLSLLYDANEMKFHLKFTIQLQFRKWLCVCKRGDPLHEKQLATGYFNRDICIYSFGCLFTHYPSSFSSPSAVQGLLEELIWVPNPVEFLLSQFILDQEIPFMF